MKALVIGAAGFVGRHLTAHLEACGDDCVTTDRSTGGPDLSDGPALDALVQDIEPDVIYHLAGQADVGASWDDPETTWAANLQGTRNVLAAARAVAGVRLIAVTSADVYGLVDAAGLPLREDAPFRPVSPYAASKAAADIAALQAFLGHGQDVIRARAFNHLGPGQSDRFVASGLASRVMHNVLEGTDVVRVGNLESRRDFTDVRDVVRAYRFMATDGRPGEAYNVCSGIDVGVREILERLIALGGRPMRVEVDPDLVRPVDLPVLRGSAAKLRDHTGWAPIIPLDETLADLLAAWRQNLTDTSASSPR